MVSHTVAVKMFSGVAVMRRFDGLEGLLPRWLSPAVGEGSSPCHMGPSTRLLSCPHNTQPAPRRSGDPRKYGRMKRAAMPSVTYLQK